MADINATLYRTYLTHNGNEVEVHPYGFDGHSIDGRREADGVFIRRYFSGKLILTNVKKKGYFDYDWIKEIEDGTENCLEISVRIERSCDVGATYSVWWEGYFTTSDGEFDLDKCMFSVEPKPDDIYRCLIDRGDVPFNIISIPTEYTLVNPGELLSYEWFVGVGVGITCPQFQAAPPTGAGWTFVDCDLTTDPLLDFAFWWREYKWTGCVAGVPVPPPGVGWVLDTNNCASTGMSKYVRVPIEPAPVVATDFTYSTCTGGVPDKPLITCPVIELVGSGCSDNWSWWWCRQYATPTYYTHTRSLYDVFLNVTQNACPDITDIVSDFFEWNPVGDAPGYVAGKNYVTGLDNLMNDLYLSQKSDILLPLATEPATVGNITFNQLMEVLVRVIPNCRWYVNGNLELRIEHVSYFKLATTADLTSGVFARILKGTNKYSYLKDRRYKREKFKWMEAYGVDFIGADIVYDPVCVDPTVGGIRPGQNYGAFQASENSITYSADIVTTDLEYIINSPSEISSNGFVLLCAQDDGAGNLTIVTETGLISGNAFLNGNLSWANLHYAFHRHDRILLEGTMNNISETFFSSKRTKAQNDFSIFDCCEGIDDSIKNNELVGEVITQMGGGMIDGYNLTLKTGKLTLKLIYE
jgi:hypothetical protein